MFQAYQIRFILGIILYNLCGSQQCNSVNISGARPSNCEEPTPILINFGQTKQLLEKVECLSQLMNGQYLNLSTALQDMKKEYTILEEKLKSRDQEIHEIQNKNNALLKLLAQNAMSNFASQVYDAAKSGDTKRVLELFLAGAPTEFEDSNKNRPLHVATENSHVKVLQALLDHKADPNIHGQYGYTPLHWTSYNGCLECAKVLLAHGANVDSRDKWQDTPLIKSAKYGYTELVKLLLDNGANINAVQEWKYSGLHMASRDGRIETVEILLHRGADHNLKNRDGKTALDLATENKHYEIMGLLKSKN